MKSIKVKIGALVLVSLLCAVVIIGGVSVNSSKSVVEQNSSDLLALQCENKAQEINSILSQIEQSVVTLSSQTLSNITNFKKFQTDEKYVNDLSKSLEDIAINLAENTLGAMTVYIRYNPEFTKPTSGIFCSRNSANGAFNKLVPTDFSMYEPTDIAHVGWYYTPVKNNKPTWLAPYLNENVNVNMISFVVPLTIDGVSVGVVGMDIDFKVLEDIVNGIKIYDTGYAFLSDGSSNIILHKDFLMNTPLNEVMEGALANISEHLKGDKSDSLLTYTYDNRSHNLTFIKLRNDMRLSLTASRIEIDKEANHLIFIIISISIIVIIVATILSIFVIMGIVKPINNLNKSAVKIANGDLNVTLNNKSHDEIGKLASSFNSMIERLRTYIDYIDETSNVLNNIANGDLSPIQLQYTYDGEFSRIKTALLSISQTLSQDMYQIKKASDEVLAGAEQVAFGSQTLSQGNSMQVTAVDNLSKIIKDLSSQAIHSLTNANSAREIINDAGTDLAHSNEKVKQMVEAMVIITKNAGEITKTIKVIDDIALQTNILAINAEIEAARAGGDAGKGFSIVAKDVKDLAAKSANSSKIISDLVRNTIISIESGEHIANETGEIIEKTLNVTKEVVGMVSNIVDISDIQTSSSENALENVTNISRVVMQNSSTAEESAAASQELTAQAQMLKELVSKFNID